MSNCLVSEQDLLPIAVAEVGDLDDIGDDIDDDDIGGDDDDDDSCV